jgi:hypothetical protein
MIYDLWDTELGNQLGVFATRDEALLAVHHLIEIDAPVNFDALLLGYEDDQGHSGAVLAGHELTSRAERLAHHRRESAS